MTSLRDVLLRFIEERVNQILDTPQMWGADESVELQVLQLMEIRFLALNPSIGAERLRAIQDSYVRFVQAKFPDEPPETLSSLLQKHHRSEELVTLLREFVVEQQASIRTEVGTFPGGLRLVDGSPSDHPRISLH
jgi:hypothetical protein